MGGGNVVVVVTTVEVVVATVVVVVSVVTALLAAAVSSDAAESVSPDEAKAPNTATRVIHAATCIQTGRPRNLRHAAAIGPLVGDAPSLPGSIGGTDVVSGSSEAAAGAS